MAVCLTVFGRLAGAAGSHLKCEAKILNFTQGELAVGGLVSTFGFWGSTRVIRVSVFA